MAVIGEAKAVEDDVGRRRKQSSPQGSTGNVALKSVKGPAASLSSMLGR